LNILNDAMEDNSLNFTRFLVLSRQPVTTGDAEEGDFKTSIVFSLNNHPGALFKAMGVFALRDIDLTKIESRPIPGQPWDYMFYIDLAGHAEGRNCHRALEHLQEMATYFRVLGSYPRRRIESGLTQLVGG
jgi:prephenate dehydratase